VREDLEPDEAREAAEEDARRDEDGAAALAGARWFGGSRIRRFAGSRVRRSAGSLVQRLEAVS
jgi:hypothetical protein